MDLEERANLEKYYHELPEEAFMELLLGDREDYREGAYDLLLAEARRRDISEEDVHRRKLRKKFSEMPRGELLEILYSGGELDEETRNFLKSEVERRHIDEEEFGHHNRSHEGGDTLGRAERVPLSGLVPVITVDTLALAAAVEARLKAAGIKYGVAFMVEEQDLEKAAAALGAFKPEEQAG